jgi:hypothetical protein
MVSPKISTTINLTSLDDATKVLESNSRKVYMPLPYDIVPRNMPKEGGPISRKTTNRTISKIQRITGWPKTRINQEIKKIMDRNTIIVPGHRRKRFLNKRDAARLLLIEIGSNSGN